VLYPADLVHGAALSDLHGEFAAVVDTKRLIAEVGRRS
jgi:hypothetical protein